MAKVLESSPPLARYDEDAHAWSLQQARLLREGRFDLVDVENVAEEIESVGRTERREIESRLEVLVLHVLKWQFQPNKRSESWHASIRVARQALAKNLKENPSLKRYPAEVLDEAHQSARIKAAAETGLPLRALPETCPYTVAELLDESFLPGPAEPMPQ